MLSTKVIIIYGAPASGKTTYVHNHLTNNDIVYDFDDLMQSLSGLPYQHANEHLFDYIMDIRSLIIKRLRTETKINKAYIITTFLSQSLTNELVGLDVEYVKMNATIEECLLRIDNSNREDKERAKTGVYDWYKKYAQKSNEFATKQNRIRFYKSNIWRGVNGVRNQALKRDSNECVWCKRDGLVTTKEMGTLEVDHIKELEYCTYDEAIDLDNLRTLCKYHHNVRHNRFDGTTPESNLKWNDEQW